jgi:hypothetical protein
MPVYHIKDPQTGLEFDIRGDSPPSEQELTQLFDELSKNQPKPRESDSGALAVAGTTAALPSVARSAATFAASPSVPRTMGKIANAATTLGALGHGAYTGNLGQVTAAPIEGWAAGRGGYFLGKGMQSLARPVARGLQAAEPYIKGAGPTVSGAMGVGDLAQMAEPTRQDIGTLGVGKTVSNDEIMQRLQQKAAAGDRNAVRSLAYLRSLHPNE